MVVLNGETFTLSQFRGVGHSAVLPAGNGRPAEPRFPDRIFSQFLVELNNVESDKTDAAASAVAAAAAEAAAEGYRDQTEGYKNETLTAKNIAVAAATSSQFPFATTGGTSSVYTINLGSPSQSIGDGFAIRVNFHTANAASPTLNIDGTGAKELVDGLNLSAGGVYRSLDANDIYAGMNLIVGYDATKNKYVIQGGFPIYELSRDLNANGYGIKNKRGYDYQVTYSGDLADGVVTTKIFFPTATRLYGLKRKVRTGAINAQLAKNGTQVISFTDSPSDVIHFTTSILTATVFEAGNSYIDFDAGDYIEATFSDNSAAADAWIALDIQENYAA
jgi:hypothetical protein